MAFSVVNKSLVRTSGVLLCGLAIFFILHLAGLGFAWIGFVVAGLLSGAMPRTGVPVGDNPRFYDDGLFEPASFTDLDGRRYVLSPEDTRVIISVRKLRLFTVRAEMEHVNAWVEIDPVTGFVNAGASVPVGTFRSGNSRRDLHVLGAQFLDASRFPTIRYTSARVDHIDAGRALVTGDLTLRGATHPVTWHVSALAADPSRRTLRAVAETSIRRSQWGMTGWQWLADDTVHIRVEIVAACDD